ncbi:hypothetical protein HYV88_05770 [Candidatus Woesearchaeota archaeon]|nr:hypothetical protein [Candidatus Woesearchaeota archaeon]
MDKILKFYSRRDIQKELFNLSQNREIAVKYGEKGFGKRPDTLQYQTDVLELAKQGVTSFHGSVERWKNPLGLKSGMNRAQLDNLRLAWDLIVDIDSKFIEYSKLTAELVIESLRFNNIKNVSCKYSGGSGFHIAIPFESFPKKVKNQETRLLFPEAPRAVAEYIKKLIKPFLTEKIISISKLADISKSLNKKPADLLEKICINCKIPAITRTSIKLSCSNCGREEILANIENKTLICVNCNSTLNIQKNILHDECPKCRNTKNFVSGKFDPFRIIEIDSQLISSRHMFRLPYSINEKSGLVSIPIKTDQIKNFKPSKAKIENVEIETSFLDTKNTLEGETNQLFMQAFDSLESKQETKIKNTKEYEIPKIAIKEDFFPECIRKMLLGIKEDGRKRAVFVLISFLQHMGWSYDVIQTRLLEWNKLNYEPLREGYILSQINWFKKQQNKILPPNCDNESYYKTLGVYCFNCKYKNPVNYVKIKLKEASNKSDNKR